MNQTINEIKLNSISMIKEANSGHCGIVLGASHILYNLYNYHINTNPTNPSWINRDRFVMSAGHGSSMLYSILHLCGFNITSSDLKSFRNLDSNTPGHPEVDITRGIECTSGPLGQGVAMGVGMAIGEKKLANYFNSIDFPIIDHYTYVFCGEGDLMEGVSYESTSLAGHLKLNKLILLFDYNQVNMDGLLKDSFSEDIKKRFNSINWNVINVSKNSSNSSINKAIEKAKRSKKPSIIVFNTIIGKDSSIENTNEAHGSVLDEKEIKNLKEKYHIEKESEFSNSSYLDFEDNFKKRELNNYQNWEILLNEYQKKEPKKYQELQNFINGKIDFTSLENYLIDLEKPIATRIGSEIYLNLLFKDNPLLIGGSADVASSVKTKLKDSNYLTRNNFDGNNIAYGIREFSMGAISNGLSLMGFNTFMGSFLAFSDYLKPSLRLSALMDTKVVSLFSHDSIIIGVDGPTHQPIEQLGMIRSIPNYNVIRPANMSELKYSYKYAFNSKNPSAIILSRQNLANLYQINELEFNIGLIKIRDNKSKINLLASGSEVNLAIKVSEELLKENLKVNVISIPSFFILEKNNNIKNELIKNKENNIAIELSNDHFWYKYANNCFLVENFASSGKGDEVVEKYFYSLEKLVNQIKKIISSN